MAYRFPIPNQFTRPLMPQPQFPQSGIIKGAPEYGQPPGGKPRPPTPGYVPPPNAIPNPNTIALPPTPTPLAQVKPKTAHLVTSSNCATLWRTTEQLARLRWL